MRENVRVKSVHFNIKNDEELLKHIGKRNFSKYMKQLIKEELERKKEPPKQPVQKGGVKYLPKNT